MAQQVDVSLSHSSDEVKKDASDIVGLMTPVIKSFFTDMGMEITNEAIQVFGGYGYTKDQGIEQLFRDNSCLLYTSPSPRDATLSRMPSSA